MPNMLQTGATWLGEQLQAQAGRSVTIAQGTTTIEDITAWYELHTHVVVDSEGFATYVQSWDWRFVTADLPAGFEFRSGAVVTETVAGVERHYEAMPLGAKPCVEPADSSGVMLTLHTKRVA